MKVCIITVYNSENCGSFWQAFALQEYLKKMGCEVYYLRRDTKDSSHSKAFVFKRFLGQIKKGNIQRAFGMLRQYRLFEKAIRCFETTEKCGDDFDICILGSDTIWNLDSQYFLNNREIYWGKASEAKKTVSYAASVANTAKSTVEKYPELITWLNKLSEISVRDEYTRSIIVEETAREITLVCDPTLLHDQSFYVKQLSIKPNLDNGRYIFVYYFGKMPEELERRIRVYAATQQCRIVVMGGSMMGDVQLNSFDPYDFIESFLHADFVVTNTFHGTLFSLNFHKQAIFNSAGKNKVYEILRKMQLLDFDYQEHNDIVPGDRQIDYVQVGALIEALREQSETFLRYACKIE